MPATNTATESRKPAATSDADWAAHNATLAAAHVNTVKLSDKLSAAWHEELSVRTKYTAKAQREANQSGETWTVLDRQGRVLATVAPLFGKLEETTEDDLLSMPV